MKKSIQLNLYVLIALLFFAPLNANATSLWSEDQGVVSSMFTDRKAKRLNDIVTVLISEQTTTARSADKSTGRDSSIDGTVSSWFTIKGLTDVVKNVLGFKDTNPAKTIVDGNHELGTKQADSTNLPAWKISTKNEHKGSGSLSRKDSVSARITCKVIEILPNNNLVIEGKQNVTVDRDLQTIVFKGVIRPDDISASNTIYSYNVADAEINFGGKGSIADKQKRGVFEFLGDLIWPF